MSTRPKIPSSKDADRRARGSPLDQLVVRTDWSAHPMGPAPEWPGSFRVTLELVLANASPAMLAWGPELSVFYNDAMASMLGAAHPAALGRGAEALWASEPTMRALIAALRGGRASVVDAALPSSSRTRMACTPITDDETRARGMLCVSLDVAPVVSQRLEQLLHTVAEPVVVVRAGVIEYANAQAEEAFGYEPGELVGLPHTTLMPERARAAHAEDSRRYLSAPSARAMSARADLTARRKDGSEFPVEISLNPVVTPRGLVVSTVIRDITQRRELEDALQRHGRRLAGAIESIPHAFFIADENDRLIAANATARANVIAAGGTLEQITCGAELRGWLERPRRVDDEQERERFAAAREQAASAETDVFDVHWMDGRSFRVTRQNIAAGGYAMIGIELTDERRRARELEIARTQAESASHSKSEFLASMSHELRTPLNAVLGFAQLLQRDKREKLSDRQRAMVDRIFQGGEHLLRLVDDVLDLARIEARGITVAPEPVAVDELLDEVLASLSGLAHAAQVRIDATAIASEVPMVHADRVRLAQVLMNLGSNAIKYNRPGGSVHIAVASVARGVRITVTDDGVGIPKEHRDRLFEPFHRAGQEAGPIEGTGIGLAISKRLTELMAGAIGYRERPEGGSEFWVELPAHRSGARSSRSSSAGFAVAIDVAPARARVRILYVEDNAANVALVREIVATLDRADFVAAHTAEAGLAFARETHPDAILMDINLPGMNGYQALAALRDAKDTADIPVIAVSAAASPSDRARAERAGFAFYVTKPVRIEELEAALATVLRRASAPG